MEKMKYTEPRLLTSALLTIDTQCDFVSPDSAALIPGSIDIIPNMTSLLNAYRQYSLPIIHIVRLYMPDGSNADLCRREILEDGLRIIVPNTPGAELVPELKPNPHVELDADLLLNGDIQTWGKKEFVIYKPRWGAFYRTPLDSHLRDLGVGTLVICGCNFPNCPRATIYEASERDYKVVLVEDAVSGIYEKAKEELRQVGVRVWPTRKLIDKISNQ